ncbi:hypothetical protein ACFWOT_28475 [Streptomyces sp. NPDC058440]|uniref:hypothetical protein n=1 Tax=Streptomyces sp. NPDC058440 TaxID=3346501 RepID=UPI00365BC5BC
MVHRTPRAVLESPAHPANPVEAIAAVTQALPQLLGDGRHIERLPLATSSLAQIEKAAQDAAAELTTALARDVENQRRRADARSERVVPIGPTPQQFIEPTADLLDHIPALCHAITRDRPEFPGH